MAESVMRRLTILLLGLVGLAHAADPTRPPEAWLNAGSVADNAVAGTALRLQSVLMPERGRPVAIIGGKTVPLGGQVGDAVLIRLSEGEAVLKGPEGVTHLYMTPGIEKHMIPTPRPRRNGQMKELP